MYYRHSLTLGIDLTVFSFIPENYCDGFAVLGGKARVVDISGNDVTANYIEGAQKTLQIVKENAIHRVILKSKSPSCGVKNIVRKGQKIKGSGVTAALLRQKRISLEEFD